jgi:hypothetical protein
LERHRPIFAAATTVTPPQSLTSSTRKYAEWYAAQQELKAISGVSKAFEAMAKNLDLDPGATYEVEYERRGTTYNISIKDPSTGKAFWTGDSNLEGGILDPMTSFHKGNPSWYLGSDWGSVLHLAMMQDANGNEVGIEGHIDTINPISGAAGFLGHFFWEVVPYFFMDKEVGQAVCSSGGCKVGKP